MKLTMIMLDPMIGEEKHRAGGAVFALVSFLKQYNPHVDDIQVRILNFNSLYSGSSNLYSTIVCENAPDIAAFSTYCWNVELVKEIALNLKQMKPDITVVLGGPEVSFNAEEILEENAQIDIIIRGEGEETFNDLIRQVNIPYPCCKLNTNISSFPALSLFSAQSQALPSAIEAAVPSAVLPLVLFLASGTFRYPAFYTAAGSHRRPIPGLSSLYCFFRRKGTLPCCIHSLRAYPLRSEQDHLFLCAYPYIRSRYTQSRQSTAPSAF